MIDEDEGEALTLDEDEIPRCEQEDTEVIEEFDEVAFEAIWAAKAAVENRLRCRMERRIPLASPKYRGLEALVDAQFYPALAKYEWHVVRDPRTFHAVRYIDRPGRQPQKFGLARAVFELAFGRATPEDFQVATADGNGLDCRFANILVEHRRYFRPVEPNYQHVWWSVRAKKWRTGKQQVNGYRTDDFGMFDCQLDAALAWDAEHKKTWQKHFPTLQIVG